MYRALMYKELREILGIVALAVIAYLALVGNLTGMRLFSWVPLLPPSGTGSFPFVDTAFVVPFSVIGAAFTIALGFRHAYWDDARQRYVLLLHRPMPHVAVILTKLFTGILAYLLCAAVPILLYGWWAATPGNYPGPFEWSMAEQSVRVWLCMPLLYLGAFLSGIRPGHWLGTRLLPLLGCAPLVPLASMVPWWWSLGLAALGTFTLVLITNICFVARVRDYS